MTTAFPVKQAAAAINECVPGAIESVSADFLLVKNDLLAEAARVLKNEPGLAFDYLADLTAVDLYDSFEVVYRLTSLRNNHSLILKVRCPQRDNPRAPSLTPVWKGADLMEREVFDLMGITFEGHPDLRRIFTWEGFEGHPLRKDDFQ